MVSVALDIDGCFADWNNAFRDVLTGRGATLRPFDESGQPDRWHWPQAYGATFEQESDAWQAVYANPEWWASLDVHSDCDDSTRELLRQLVTAASAEVSFVTARPNGRAASIAWVADKWGHTVPVMRTPSYKPHALLALDAMVVIEDDLNTLARYRDLRNNYSLPTALLLLIDRPYNRPTSDRPRLRDGLTVVPNTNAALRRALLEVL